MANNVQNRSIERLQQDFEHDPEGEWLLGNYAAFGRRVGLHETELQQRREIFYIETKSLTELETPGTFLFIFEYVLRRMLHKKCDTKFHIINIHL